MMRVGSKGERTMTQSQLGKIWVAIGLFVLYYSLNSWIVCQGGEEIFGAKLVLPTRIPAAFIAIPICSVALMAWTIVGTTYAHRSHGAWHHRIPVVFFDGIETGTTEGRIYQGTCFFVVLLLTLGALAHFWDVVSGATVLASKAPFEPVSLWDSGTLGDWNDPARICTSVDPKTGACVEGCTFYRFSSPVFSHS